ncbi:MAG: LysM peptidoglycan-binding domain-containing protein [Nitrospirota bacterium]
MRTRVHEPFELERSLWVNWIPNREFHVEGSHVGFILVADQHTVNTPRYPSEANKDLVPMVPNFWSRLHSVPKRIFLCAVGIVFLLPGCSGTRASSYGPSSQEAHTRAATIVRDREAELATIRAEMAATRIAAAKKEAELQELRSLVHQLRQENAESHQVVRELRQAQEARQVELATLRSERDQLRQAKNEQQFKALTDSLLALTKELGEVKEGLMQSAVKPTVKQKKSSDATKPGGTGSRENAAKHPSLLPSATPAPTRFPGVEPALHVISEPMVSAPQPRHITVQAGETLWSLARQYKMTVEAIKQANRLSRDQLVVGQELVIPTPQNRDGEVAP